MNLQTLAIIVVQNTAAEAAMVIAARLAVVLKIAETVVAPVSVVTAPDEMSDAKVTSLTRDGVMVNLTSAVMATKDPINAAREVGNLISVVTVRVDLTNAARVAKSLTSVAGMINLINAVNKVTGHTSVVMVTIDHINAVMVVTSRVTVTNVVRNEVATPTGHAEATRIQRDPIVGMIAMEIGRTSAATTKAQKIMAVVALVVAVNQIVGVRSVNTPRQSDLNIRLGLCAVNTLIR